jgi:hypothetical protein
MVPFVGSSNKLALDRSDGIACGHAALEVQVVEPSEERERRPLINIPERADNAPAAGLLKDSRNGAHLNFCGCRDTSVGC